MCATHRDGMDAPDIGVGATISPSFDAMVDQGVGATISPSFDTMVGEVISDVAIGVDTGTFVNAGPCTMPQPYDANLPSLVPARERSWFH